MKNKQTVSMPRCNLTPEELFEALKQYKVRVLVQKNNKVYIQWLGVTKVSRRFNIGTVNNKVFAILQMYPYEITHGTGKDLTGRSAWQYMSACRRKLYVLE